MPRPAELRATLNQDLGRLAPPHSANKARIYQVLGRCNHVDGKIWCELVVTAPNSAKLKIWSIKIPDKNHLLVTILASC